MPNEKIGAALPRAFQQVVQLVHQAQRRARARSGIAPAEPGPVVSNHARKAGKLRLHQCPAVRPVAVPGFQEDCGTARLPLAGCVQVQRMPADIDPPAGRVKAYEMFHNTEL